MTSYSLIMALLESGAPPKIRAEIQETENPNDHESSKAVDITFYNEKNEKIGEASVSAINTKIPFLYNVEVFKKYRGQGYANAMMRYILKEYKPKQLTVEPSNKVAISLYKKHGFYYYGDYQDGDTLMHEMRRK